MFWRKLYLLASSRISIHVLLFHVISHSLVVGLNAPAIYKFSLPSILETLQSSKFIEYSHIPKCGTASRKICDQGQLPCLPLLQLRKCGHHGEDCDWLAKYNCVGKRKIYFLHSFEGTSITCPITLQLFLSRCVPQWKATRTTCRSILDEVYVRKRA